MFMFFSTELLFKIKPNIITLHDFNARRKSDVFKMFLW